MKPLDFSLFRKVFKKNNLIAILFLSCDFLVYAQPNALDPSFVNGTFTNTGTTISSVYGSVVQADGKVIVVGEFTHYNGVSRIEL